MLVRLSERLGEFDQGEEIAVAPDVGRALVRDGRASLAGIPGDDLTEAPTIGDVRRYAAEHGIRNLRDAAKQMSAHRAGNDPRSTPSPDGDPKQGEHHG